MTAMPKLLYILPDLAYVAELLPTKKPFTYAIHNFRQINGEFLDDNEFIEANIGRLLDRLDVADYIVVLPDYLFTDTIVNVRADSEIKVKEYLKSQLLPGLEIDTTSHQIETFILTEFKGMYKVQLSALERSLMAPLARSMAQRGLTVQSVVSLSWATKSIVSLEPSITVLQMGDKLYLAQHYIGIDQTSFAPVLESTNIVETIKTLKGAEPSIQTVYVLASEVVAAQLKEELHDLVPVQQLAVFNEADAKMPSYVKQVIEAGMRSLTAPDYLLPKFAMEKAAPAEIHAEAPMTTVAIEETEELEEAPVAKPASSLPMVEELEESTLPKPKEQKESLLATTSSAAVVHSPEPISVAETLDSPRVVAPAPVVDPSADDTLAAAELEKLFGTTDTAEEPASTESLSSESSTASSSKDTWSIDPVDQFIVAESHRAEITPEKPVSSAPVAKTAPTKHIIKNQTDEKNMVKLLFIGLASFFATVGVGIGLGLGIMMVSNKKPASQTTIIESAVPSMAPTPTVMITPTGSASTVTASNSAKTPVKNPQKVLVVNATKIPGHAGQTASKLKAAGFSSVQTGNAAGTYEKGSYVLLRQADDALVASVTKASGLALQSAKGIDTEDPKKLYDVVIVLAE